MAVLAISGCFLTDKRITDVYSLVHGIPQGDPEDIAEIRFPRPSQILIEGRILDSVGTTLGIDQYPLKAKPSKTGSTIPSQKFPVDLDGGNNCVPDGGSLLVAATPIDADILQNAKLKTSVRVK